MTTAIKEAAVPVEGTNFVVEPFEVAWEHGSPRVLQSDFLDDGDLSSGGLFEDFLGDQDAPDAAALGLPGSPGSDLDPEEAFRLAWVPRYAPTGSYFASLWRREDAEYVARQVYDACPEAWNLPDQGARRRAVPDRVRKWLRLAPRLLNRGVPRDLIVNCKDYAASR